MTKTKLSDRKRDALAEVQDSAILSSHKLQTITPNTAQLAKDGAWHDVVVSADMTLAACGASHVPTQYRGRSTWPKFNHGGEVTCGRCLAIIGGQ